MITAEPGWSLVSCVRFSIKPKWSVGRKPKPGKAATVLTPEEKPTGLLHLVGSELGQNETEVVLLSFLVLWRLKASWASVGEFICYVSWDFSFINERCVCVCVIQFGVGMQLRDTEVLAQDTEIPEFSPQHFL